MVEVIANDDAQDADTAAMGDPRSRGWPGCRPSSGGSPVPWLVTLPITGEAGVLQVSPTITSMTFHGRDDNLFRINRTTRDNARDYAKVTTGRGLRKFAVAVTLRNRSFTNCWLAEFRVALQSAGAEVVAAVPYELSSGP